jgi:hypothetical protein
MSIVPDSRSIELSYDVSAMFARHKGKSSRLQITLPDNIATFELVTSQLSSPEAMARVTKEKVISREIGGSFSLCGHFKHRPSHF